MTHGLKPKFPKARNFLWKNKNFTVPYPTYPKLSIPLPTTHHLNKPYLITKTLTISPKYTRSLPQNFNTNVFSYFRSLLFLFKVITNPQMAHSDKDSQETQGNHIINICMICMLNCKMNLLQLQYHFTRLLCSTFL